MIEDNAAVRSLVTHVLAEHGVRVLEAADANEALAVFDRRADEVDVVLTDIVMPGTSGVEVAERLRRERPALPVVYMTGYAGDDTILPADAPLLQKPFTPDDLVRSLAGVLPARLPMAP